ncbi:MAG: transglutaminase family protein [Planctomycetota bacterium]
MTSPHGIPEPDGPTAEQIAATIRLLGDERGQLVEMARERLLCWGEPAIEQLQVAAEADAMLVRLRARAVLRAFEVQKDLRRFGLLRLDRTGRGSAPSLLEGIVLLSRMVRTFVPGTDDLGRRLRRHATALKRECDGRSLPTCARLLAARLHDQAGLVGNRSVAVDLDRVLVDRVLEGGSGEPVALALVYLLVARWAGLSAAGVAMPDYFLVRLHGTRPVLVDPLHGGRTITKADCARYLRATGHDLVKHHLRDLTDREMLIHYLRALQRAAQNRAVPEARETLGQAMSLLETAW